MTGLLALPVRRLAACLALVTLMVALPLSAGELFQWKDASGVTHYSDAPPPSGQYQNRRITDSGAGTASEATAEATVENSQCTTARANLALLEGEGPIQMQGSDGDGEATAMNAEQREAQKQLAQAAINAYCGGAANQ
ncbi:DUF4124 domain-containing protein [Novilysobacter antarcticus]|uniref:DUF4124 domain-containing protein n=1 Tax=Novilysobacter antarcticus TaxID=2862543 RepID=UPI001FECCAD8|nr:DUF4124 domain-containing protein [Lysobacter antarcticus]